jgi:hypothetical protein
VPNGTYKLVATANDAAGNLATSEPVNITIDNDSSPPVVSNVQANPMVDASGIHHYAEITWDTNEDSDSRVDYTMEYLSSSGKWTFDQNYGSDKDCVNPQHCFKDSGMTQSHKITLNNLEANKRYHYRVSSCDDHNNCGH